ncbi:hypothetical protein QFC20_007181 [Naganishia adeliensis]|uniref:Uncharacterized protein n=1 Tax=Naganishia adeliensis TaxID=92952 RepID=A0ACC2V1Z8_9TREE|nr:hypothetical protein QFC20_007181 [Naganishia adeliensis]
MNNSSSSSATQCCAIAGPSRATGISMSSSSQLPGGAHSNQRSDPEDQEDRSQRGELSVPVETKSSRKHKRQKSNKASKGGDQQPQSAAVTRDQPPAGQGKHHAKNKKRENKAKFEKRDVRQRAERRVYSHRAVFTTSQDDLISTSVGSVGFKERFAAKAINPASSVEDIVREVQSQDRPTRDAEVWIAKGKNMDKVRTCLNAEINDSKTGADVTLVVEGMEHGDKMVAVAQQLLLNNEIYAVVFNPADSAVPVSRCHPSEQDISESLDEIGVVGTDKQEFKVVDDLQSTKTARQQRDSLTPADMAKVWRSTDSSSMAARAPASSLGLKRRDPQKLVNLSPKAYYQDLRIAREATDALLAAQGAAPSKSSISTVKKNLPIQSAPAVLPGAYSLRIRRESDLQWKHHPAGETDNNFQEDKKDITLFYDGDKDKCLTKPLRKRLPAVMDKFTREFHFWALQATTGMLTIRHYDAAGGLSWIRMVAGEKLWIVYKMDPIEGLVKVDAVVLRPGSVM